ncbi:MAG: phospholipase D-like domain-containing protein [Candidatus Cybelea sp.]
MSTTLKAYANCSDVFLVWQVDKEIPNCLGFAVQRKINGVQDVLNSSVGFGDQAPGPNDPNVNPGAFKPTTQWPLQRFTWTDFTIQAGQTVQYRVVPMVGTDNQLRPDDSQGSLWTNPVTLTGDSNNTSFSAFFNDGVLATQWLARELQTQPSMSNSVAADIAQKGNPVRVHLGGAILQKLVGLLQEAHDDSGATIYAALFELDDIELVPLLQTFGPRAHVVLSNGSVKGSGDENANARADLKKSGVNVYDRMLANPHLGHNKFLVLCSGDTPQKVWTGSTNWTKTGLCTQANNGLLISNPAIAAFYKQQWQVLADGGSDFPPSDTDTLRNSFSVGTTKLTVSFTPWPGTAGTISATQPADLAYAVQLIKQAKNGILFLQFMPGPRGTLLEAINDRNADPNLYVRGVVNQDPSTTKTPVVGLFHQGEAIPASFDVLLPEAIDQQISYWDPEIKKLATAHAIVHSKVIVLDPFGDHPVVMTGSHNMGTKASISNDENLVIIENNPDLARQYAVNIITVFNQYWWRYNRMKPSDRNVTPSKDPNTQGLLKIFKDKAPQDVWTGLSSTDAWQKQYFTNPRLIELKFWLGAAAVVQPTAVKGTSAAKPASPPSDGPGDGAAAPPPRKRRPAKGKKKAKKQPKRPVRKVKRRPVRKAKRRPVRKAKRQPVRKAKRKAGRKVRKVKGRKKSVKRR